MIDLVSKADGQGIGIEAFLSTERIPYARFRSGICTAGQLLLIATSSINDEVAARAHREPALVIGDVPPQLKPLFPASTRETVLHSGQCVWCPLPLGAAFTSLLTESYAPHPQQRLTPKLAPDTYYRLPEWIRSRVQRSVYKKLRHALAAHPDPSEYPVDRSGLILSELLKTLIRQSAGGLVRIERWPAPYHCAAALTHDIEPSAFSYRHGLPELLQVAAESGHAPSLGLVTKAARKYLGPRFPLSDLNVYCHGLEHRGETVAGTRDQIASVLRQAKFELEQLARRDVRGFRSPRLDRSPDMFMALSESGFEYSSSAPDVDRESMARFGGGVRWNLPFRMPLQEQHEQFGFSDCLELPVSAPDCIQPLFGGESVEELRTAVRHKVDAISQSGGMYIGIVHAGVFGPADAARRMEHLRFVVAELDRPGLWKVSMDEIADWWRRREQVRIEVRDGHWLAINDGDDSIAGLRFVAEDSQGNECYREELPVLASGGSALIDFPSDQIFGVMNHATSI